MCIEANTKQALSLGKSLCIDVYKRQVLKNGGEGVGLFRTEFLYMDNDHFPTEEEQFEAYKAEMCIRDSAGSIESGFHPNSTFKRFKPESYRIFSCFPQCVDSCCNHCYHTCLLYTSY